MLHLKGNSDEEIMERMIKETEVYYRNGVDAVLVENYFGCFCHLKIQKRYTKNLILNMEKLDSQISFLAFCEYSINISAASTTRAKACATHIVDTPDMFML